jgi:hypothetical protein
VPVGVRAALERRLGARVVDAVTQPQGFSPGLAARGASKMGDAYS